MFSRRCPETMRQEDRGSATQQLLRHGNAAVETGRQTQL